MVNDILLFIFKTAAIATTATFWAFTIIKSKNIIAQGEKNGLLKIGENGYKIDRN